MLCQKEIAESIMYIDNACDVWADLHERFYQSNGPIIFQIKQQLSSLSQGSQMLVVILQS